MIVKTYKKAQIHGLLYYLSKAKANIEVLVAEDFMVVPVQAS